jgi:uncharacterized C2H2 Zn-finger protein
MSKSDLRDEVSDEVSETSKRVKSKSKPRQDLSEQIKNLELEVQDESQTFDEKSGEIKEVQKSEPDSEARFRCPDCGSVFDSQKSLEAHRLKKHGVAPSYLKRDKGERRVSYQPSLTETKVPDAYEDLRSELVKFGLSTRDVEAVTEYMKNFSPDDLPMLNQAVKDVGMPLNRRRIFFISYSRRRGIPIPPELCDELGITPYDTSPSYGYSSWKRPRYEGETSISDMIALFLSQQKSQTDIVLETIRQQNEWMRSLLLNRSNRESEDPSLREEIREMREENRELRQKYEEILRQLQEEKHKRLEEKVAELERKLEEKSTNVEVEKVKIAREAVQGVLRLGDYIVKGSMEPVTPPKRKEDKSMSELSVEELESLGIPYEIEGGGE